MKQYVIYTILNGRACIARESEMWDNKNQHYFTWHKLDMTDIRKMKNGKFKYTLSLEEAQRLLRKAQRYVRHSKSAKKHFTRDIVIVPISKLVKINKDKLKEQKRKQVNKL